MRLSVQEVNKSGVVLDKLKMQELTEKYIIQYNNNCYLLWSLGYLTSPFYYDECDFMHALPINILELFKDKLSGGVNLTVSMFDYILKRSRVSEKYNIDEEYTSILRIARDIVEAETALKDYESLSKSVRIPKRSDTFSIKVYLSVSTSVYNSGKAPIDSQYVQDLIKIEDNEEIYKLRFADGVVMNLCKKINYPMTKFYEHVSTNKSIFLGSGFTFDDDIKYLDLIQCGIIEGESNAGKKLYSTIFDYYSSYHDTVTTNTRCVKFEHQNFVDSVDDCIDYVRYKKEKAKENGYLLKYVNSSYIIYSRQRTSSEGKPKKSMFIGSFIYDNVTGERLNVVNQLRGISGEFISYDNIYSKEYLGYGLSIKMLDKYGIERDYYPILCSSKYDGSDVSPSVSKIEFRDPEVECKRLEISEMGDISHEVADSIDVSYNGRKLDKLIGILVQALICVECDYTLTGHISPNHVILDDDYSWLDSDGWNLAYVKSTELFYCLGF